MTRWGDRIFLGSGSGPAVEFVDVAKGERVPWPEVPSMPFDSGLVRDGWIAIQTGAALHAVRDGDVASLVRLPDVWTIEPAAAPDQILARPRRGPKLVLLDRDGQVLRSTSDVQQPAGELHDGTIVCERDLRSWDGARSPLPVAGATTAVLGGRVIVTLDDDDQLRSIDTADGSTADLDLRPYDAGYLGFPVYSPTAERAAWASWGTLVVAGPGVALHARHCPKDTAHVIWLDEQHLLLFGEKTSVVLDLATGTTEAIDLPRRAWPVLDVTGRLDPAATAAATAAPQQAPAVDAAAWAAEIDAQQARIADAASAAGLGPEVAAGARPAIRLAPFRGPGPLGGTRLGGIPDVPAGWSWPHHDGAPLAFLAQIRLDAVHPGLLVLFAAIETDGSYPAEPYVVHVEAFAPGIDLAPAEQPDELDADLRYEPAAAVPEPYVSPPNWDALEAAYGMDPIDTFYPLLPRAEPHHQVGGLARCDQGHPPPEGKQLLLQLDSDSIMGVMWGDGGRLFFWGPPELPASGVVEGCELDHESM